MHGGKLRELHYGLKFIENVAIKHEGADCLFWPGDKFSNGYARVKINGRARIASRVVCHRVHGDPPTPKHEAAHSCGNGRKGCVNPKHLRWATPQENNLEKYKHGTMPLGERNPSAKLTKTKVIKIRELEGRYSKADIARRFGVSDATIHSIHKKETWSWL
jgi:hypothetical protein